MQCGRESRRNINERLSNGEKCVTYLWTAEQRGGAGPRRRYRRDARRKLNPPANWIDKLRIEVTCTRCRAARQNHTGEGVVAFAITTPESNSVYSATLSFLVAWRNAAEKAAINRQTASYKVEPDARNRAMSFRPSRIDFPSSAIIYLDLTPLAYRGVTDN